MNKIQFAIMVRMEKNYRKVVRIFFGTRADLAPYPLAFLWDCQRCHAPTYSAAEPPPDQMPVCNICAFELSAAAQQNPTMDVSLDLTAEGKDIVRDIAAKNQRPVAKLAKITWLIVTFGDAGGQAG
jgi:hypothetical protein